MSSYKQFTVNPPATEGGLGAVGGVSTANTATQKVMFSDSPIGEGVLQDDGTLEAEIRKNFQELALDNVSEDCKGVLGYYMVT